MFDTLFHYPRVLARHRDGPSSQEREAFKLDDERNAIALRPANIRSSNAPGIAYKNPERRALMAT